MKLTPGLLCFFMAPLTMFVMSPLAAAMPQPESTQTPEIVTADDTAGQIGVNALAQNEVDLSILDTLAPGTAARYREKFAAIENDPMLSESDRMFKRTRLAEEYDRTVANIQSRGPFPISGGGREVPISVAPFQVQIRYADTVTNAQAPGIDDAQIPRWQTRHICGGVLIDKDWVMTAAHCVSSAHVKVGLVVQIGSANIAANDGMAVAVDRLVRHARFKPANKYDYDIALLHLARDGQRRGGRKLQTATLGALPTDGKTNVGATGWGITKGQSGQPVAFLREVRLATRSAEQCASDPEFAPIRTPMGLVTRVHDRVFCAGGMGKKTCPGDSGGPVYHQVYTNGIAEKPVVVGIISWAKKGCGIAEDDRPGVYTKIAAYLDWIKRAKRTQSPTIE